MSICNKPGCPNETILCYECVAAENERLRVALAQERGRIANRLEEEAGLSPCKEDGSVYRSAAWLVRADFSYEEAERLEVAAEVGDQQSGSETP